MTTQSESPAVGSEASAPEADNTDPFMDMAEELLGPDAEEDELQDEEADEGETPEDAEEVAEETTDEPEEELPPIPAPNSWDAEAKERFAKLPREDQEYLAKREGERERFVQAKSQEAAQAQRNATVEAMKQVEQVKAEAVQHLQRYLQQPVTPPPTAELFRRDPMAYAQQLEKHQNDLAQHQQAQQEALRFQAEQAQIQQARKQHEAEAFHQQLQAEVPELFDPTRGQELAKKLSATAELLGFDPNDISDVGAIKALKITSEKFEKADKYDALMKKQMERVRSGKNPPPIAKPGTARSPNETRAKRANAAWQSAVEGSAAGNRQARDAGFAAWATESGWLD